MKVTLVQPPLLERGREDLTAPLGLLTLGAVLREESVDVEVIDFNLKGFQDPSYLDPTTFYQAATDRIAHTNPDVVGFTSMGLESHVCLKLAHLLKQRDPGVTTLFGGAHFGSIATQVLELYPWTDYVVTGAAEQPLIDLVRHLRDDEPGTLFNIAHRRHGGVELERRLGRNIPLDDLPFPAHDLIDVEEYFAINPLRMLCLEHARGCQLRCSFCYSEAHWGHGETVKRTERVVAELTALSELGAGLAFLVADNFVTSKKAAIELCGAIAEARLPIRLKCYATLAQLTPPVVEAMAEAKCVAVFVGVDAVSADNRRDLKKTYFKGWERLRATLESCMDHGVHPTCSFMLTPSDTLEGTEHTLRTAVFTKAIGAYVCVNALGVYNRTGIERRREASEVEYGELKPALLFDTPEINVQNPYARKHPRLFPMHQCAGSDTVNQNLAVFCHVAYSLVLTFPLTLLRFAVDDDGELVELIRRVGRSLGPWLEKGVPLTNDRLSGDVVDALRTAIDSTGIASSVLEYELTARLPLESDVERLMKLDVGGLEIPCRLGSYRLIELCFPPTQIARLKKIQHQINTKTYVVVSRLGVICLVELDDDLRPVLAALVSNNTARAVVVEFNMYQDLKQYGLVTPALDDLRTALREPTSKTVHITTPD